MLIGDRQLATRPSQKNLFRLWLIRSLLVAGLFAGLVYIHLVAHIDMPVWPLVFILGLMVFFNLLVGLRLLGKWPVGETEFYFNLLFDLFSLAALLYFSGGSTNPLISYFLIPLIISAAVLRPVHTWTIALAAVGLYGLLMFFYIPFVPFAGPSGSHAHHGASAFMSAHFTGMWINFAFSACLIAWFVVRMSQTMREQEERLARSREQVMRDEQIIGVAGIAANIAHELRTPLATMTVMADEMLDRRTEDDEEWLLMQKQLERCDGIIRELVSSAANDGQPAATRISELVSEIRHQWGLARPEVHLSISLPDDLGRENLVCDQSLQHALLNFLNNAADASPADVSIQFKRSGAELEILICDRGEGVPLEIAGTLGRRLISGKQGGLGLGVLISSASIERLGGEVALRNRKGGGTRLEIRLPLGESQQDG